MPSVSRAVQVVEDWAAAEKAWKDMEAELDAQYPVEDATSSCASAESVEPAQRGTRKPARHPRLSYKDLLENPAAAVVLLDASGYMVVTNVCTKAEASRHLEAISREHDSAYLRAEYREKAAAISGAKGCSLLKRHGFAYMKSVQQCRTTIG